MTEAKTITCRAAVLKEAGGPFVVEHVQVEPPQEKEVRVTVSSAGICHSDQHGAEGMFKTMPFPLVLGHEGAGVVESVGPGVTTVAPGDGVVFLFEGYCGECDLCKSPKTNRCANQGRDGFMRDGTARMSLQGAPLRQFVSVGCFSECVVVPEMNVVKVDPNKVPLSQACLVGCCIPTGYGAAVKCARVEPGATCAVWGLGGVGLNVVFGCKQSKASKIIGIDLNEKKFEHGAKFGCTDFINPSKCEGGVLKALEKLTGGGGPDYCFVSVGIVPVMEEAFACSNQFWGQTVIVGLSDFEETVKTAVWGLLGGRQLRGTLFGSYKAKLEIPGLLDELTKTDFDLFGNLITHVIPLDKINEGFDLLKKGESIRTVIDFKLKA